MGLAEVIDLPVAEMYAKTLEAYRRATERLLALRATLAVVPSVSAEDTQFLRQVIADQATAGRVFKAAGAEVLAALTKAEDTEPDETQGRDV